MAPWVVLNAHVLVCVSALGGVLVPGVWGASWT